MQSTASHKNYINTVPESGTTVRLANVLTPLVISFVAPVMTNSKEGMKFELVKTMFIAAIFTLAEGISRWCKEMFVEARSMGNYAKKVATGLTYSTILFIGSELFLFASLIGTAFDGFANQSVHVSTTLIEQSSPLLWYGEGIAATVILLLSSCTFNTYKALYDGYDASDYFFLNGSLTQSLGIWFMLFQLEEYTKAALSIFISNPTAGFYVVTGFHGLHVAIGWFMLTLQTELSSYEFRSTSNIGLFYSLIYWHFVDGVWFVVVFLIYYHMSMPIATMYASKLTMDRLSESNSSL